MFSNNSTSLKSCNHKVCAKKRNVIIMWWVNFSLVLLSCILLFPTSSHYIKVFYKVKKRYSRYVLGDTSHTILHKHDILSMLNQFFFVSLPSWKVPERRIENRFIGFQTFNEKLHFQFTLNQCILTENIPTSMTFGKYSPQIF